jgi:hypothetical protein
MNAFKKEAEHRTSEPISLSELAQLGDGQVAYIKQLDSDAAERLFPALSDAPEGIDLFAVLGADGTPLALTDSRSEAIANAIENDLVPVSVH